jgi:hypothetical protein
MGNPAGMARRVFDAYNAGDPEALRTPYEPSARTRRPGWPDDGGVDELVACAEMDMVAFPDVRLAPVFSVTEGGAIMSEVRITETNTGEIVLSDFGRGATGTTGETFSATGRSMDITGVIVHETNDGGLIVAERQYWNMLELLAQLACSCRCPRANRYSGTPIALGQIRRRVAGGTGRRGRRCRRAALPGPASPQG